MASSKKGAMHQLREDAGAHEGQMGDEKWRKPLKTGIVDHGQGESIPRKCSSQASSETRCNQDRGITLLKREVGGQKVMISLEGL
jgi:hypothetical protein